MKIKTQLIIMIGFLVFISSCSSKEIRKNGFNGNEKASTSEVSIKDDTKNRLDEEKIGMIEVSGDNVYYVINWKSRSRKTFKVTGNLVNEIKKLNGKVIQANGEKKLESTWSGTIDIQSYKIIE